MRRMGSGLSAVLLAALAVAGCTSGHRAAASSYRTVTTARHAARPAAGSPASRPAPWPARQVLTDQQADADDQSGNGDVLDPAGKTLYALQTADPQASGGRWLLQAIRVPGGRVIASRVVTASFALTGFYGGYLWASDQDARGDDRIIELDPRTLAMVRSVGPPASTAGEVAPGGGGSVWTEVAHALLRISARTGAVLSRIALPAGFGPADIATSPGGALVYVSARLPGGGGMVREYSAADGRLLASTAEDWSVTSPALVAMPGRLWIFGRTGMMGESALLSQHNLAVLAQASEARTGPYTWGPWADAIYADGALWWVDSSGLLACVDPVTGRMRASVTRWQQSVYLYQLLAVAGGQVYGVTENGIVLKITPPASCRG
jgi:hypothetical protein